MRSLAPAVAAVLCIALLRCVAAGAPGAPPVPTKPPRWSWDTVPLFAHASSNVPYNATQLAYLANMSLVTFDKGQFSTSMPGASFEDRATAAAKQVRAAMPAGSNIAILYYMNLLINFPIFAGIYNATTAMPGKYLLHNSGGHLVTMLGPGYTVLDHSKAATRALFLAECKGRIASGAFDGCFIDRANYAYEVVQKGITRGGWDQPTGARMINASKQMFADLTAGVGTDHIILAKEACTAPGSLDYEVANAAMPSDTFCSNYNTQANYNATRCLQDVLLVQAYARRGQLTESHGMGPPDDDTQMRFTLACFLVAAGQYSYYTYATEQKGLAWSIEGVRWWPEYERPLGAPTGEAARDGWTFTRSFSSGTRVTVDIQKHTASIEWGSRA